MEADTVAIVVALVAVTVFLCFVSYCLGKYDGAFEERKRKSIEKDLPHFTFPDYVEKKRQSEAPRYTMDEILKIFSLLSAIEGTEEKNIKSKLARN